MDFVKHLLLVVLYATSAVVYASAFNTKQWWLAGSSATIFVICYVFLIVDNDRNQKGRR